MGLADRQIARPTCPIEMSLKRKNKGEPGRDHYPGIPTTDHSLLLSMREQIGGQLQLFPGSRQPSKLEQANTQCPASEDECLIAPRLLGERQDLARNFVTIVGFGANEVVQV